MLDCGQPDDGAVEVPTFDDMDWDGFPDIVLDPLDWVLSDSFQHEGLDDERTLKDYLDGLCDLDNQQQFDQFEQQQQQHGDATSPTSIFLEGSAKSPDEGSSTNIGFDDAIGKDDDGAGAFLQKEDGMTMMNGGGGGGGGVERWDSSSGSNHVGGDPERGSPKQGLGHLRPVTTGIPQDCGGVGGGGGAGSPGGGINSSRQVETGKIPSQLHQTCGEVEQQDGSQPRSSQLRSDDSPIGGENWRTTSSQVNNGIAVVSHPYPHPFAAQNGDNSPMIGAGSPESDDGGDLTAPAVAAGGKPNKRKKPDVDWEAIKDPEERRRQRRLAKNRHTAAVSRERKKAQMRTLEERVSKLEEDNAALRYWLQYREQELHSLTSHLASLPKGAGEGVVPNPSHGAGSEPAVLELSSDLATMLLELLLLVWPLAQMLAVVQRVLYAACISKRLSQLMGRECNDAKKLEAPGIAFLARKLSKRGLRCGVSVQYPEGYWHSRNFKNWWSRHYYIGQRVLGL